MLSVNIDAIMFAACAHAALTCADALASLGSVSMRLMIMGFPPDGTRRRADSAISVKVLSSRPPGLKRDGYRDDWARHAMTRSAARGLDTTNDAGVNAAFFDERRIKI